MNNLKHTPGPWSVDGFSLTSVIAEIGESKIGKIYKHVCDCNYGYLKPDENLELNKANARLIASAPGMLDCLINIYKNPSHYPFNFCNQVKTCIESATGQKIEEVIKA